MLNYYTVQKNFYGNRSPKDLLKEFGSPLYVYNESILRKRCREMANLVPYPKFKSNFSIKANSNLEMLKIARDEGLHADAMSPGEIFVLLMNYKNLHQVSLLCLQCLVILQTLRN
jgi:diaminopimelate decarboxylase